jgi:exodeoxyribonuclease V alpha subunit
MTTLDRLAADGFLSPLDVHLARTLGRLGGEARPDVLLAIALANQHVAAGNVCMELRTPLLADPTETPLEDLELPPAAAWLEAVRASPLASDGSGAPAPLVVDREGRLYLRRLWEYEERLGALLRERADALDDDFDAARFRPALDRILPRTTTTEPDRQRVAAFVALRRRLCVITGGPGSGKTTAVARIAALRVEQALAAGRRAPRITLAAPTGKAAARLTEAIRLARERLDCSPEVRAAIPEEAQTIHRVLGARPSGRPRYARNERSPLRTDLLIVDEASMIDLALMTHLLNALPRVAGLILLGDKDQLASVEAGAVLADICQGDGRGERSAVFAAEIEAATGERTAAAPEAPAGIRDCIVELTRSHRYGTDSDVAALAEGVRRGDGDHVLALLDDPGRPAVTRVEPSERARFRADVLAGYGPYLEAEAARDRLAALERFRVLCAHRGGDEGVERVNPEVERTLADGNLLDPRGAFYERRPILVTQNDHRLGLFNGDVGTIVPGPQDDRSRLAFFIAPDGSERLLSPARLPPCETAFALTVHKSQGSEFDAVAVVLPKRPSPIVSRELLYTAVSRARTRVTVYATDEVLRRALATPVRRLSGLGRRLWQDD